MLRLVVVWWLPEGDQPGALEVGVTECASLVDLAFERQNLPCRVLEFFEYTPGSIPGCIDSLHQMSAFMHIRNSDDIDTIQRFTLKVMSDILNRMLKKYQWDWEKQEIVPRT